MGNKKEKVALVLAGGGSRGAYEAGAWQALTELGVEIDIVTGTSVGAVNGAMVCQQDLENTIKLWKELETHMIFDIPEGGQTKDYAKEWFHNGGAGATGLKEILDKYLDEDLMRKSPVDFGLVAVELNGLKPHFLFKEDMEEGHIKDYIQASSSIYPAVQPCTIDGVEYIDGGYADVLPINMAIERGATQIIAVKLNAVGKLKHEPLQNTQNLTVIESKWDLGNTLVFDTQNARRIMRLGYLDTMRTYNVFDGYYYTFAKNAFGRIDLKLADTSAKLFELDPTIIYTKAMLLRKLSSSVNEFTEKMEEAIHTIKSTTLNRSSIVNLVKGIKDVTDSKILCLAIASNIKEKGDSSIFLSKSISKLLSEQITAAKFLVKYGIIE